MNPVLCDFCQTNSAAWHGKNSGLSVCGMGCYRLVKNKLTSTGSGTLRLVYTRTGGLAGRHMEIHVFDDGTAGYKGKTTHRLPFVGSVEKLFDWAMHVPVHDPESPVVHDAYHMKLALYDKDGREWISKEVDEQNDQLLAFEGLVSRYETKKHPAAVELPLGKGQWKLEHFHLGKTRRIWSDGSSSIRSSALVTEFVRVEAPEAVFLWAVYGGRPWQGPEELRTGSLRLYSSDGVLIDEQDKVGALPELTLAK